jgi:hypothetical protein
MKVLKVIFTIGMISFLASCSKSEHEGQTNIMYLHHSTGRIIWGTKTSLSTKIAWRFNKLYDFIGKKSQLPRLFEAYNQENGTNYHITKKPFPKVRPYGWKNYPYDYYNIWVKHAGETPYKKEPTLEILTRDYQVIIFKHCFPSSKIKADNGDPDINSDIRTLANYKLQYEALKKKMHEFPDTKFILFTGAVHVKENLDEEDALRAKQFHDWVLEKWDDRGDNIFVWDLYALQTEGGLYFKDEYAVSSTDSHPNEAFADKAGKLLFNRIIDVVENNGEGTLSTGESL